MDIVIEGIRYAIGKAFDISIPIAFDTPRVRAFGLDYPTATSLLDVRQGASCNCDTVHITPHGAGTHTEGVGHLLADRRPVQPPPPLMRATLVTVRPEPEIQLQSAFDTPAVVLRSGAEPRDWTGTNPPYLSASTAAHLRAQGVRHLVVDLPSVDREDEAQLSAHRAFFGLPDSPDDEATITELASIPAELPDGLYLLQLALVNWRLDAVPSTPTLMALAPVAADPIPPPPSSRGPGG